MDSPFFTFIKPYLGFIDCGDIFRKPFNWLFKLFAVGNIILPIYFFYLAVDNDLFDAEAKYVFIFLLIWIILAFAGWIGFQLWWNRSTKVSQSSGPKDDFVAIPVVAEFIQTTGEWIGTWLAIVGSSLSLITTVFISNSYMREAFFSAFGMFDLASSGLISVVLFPVIGLLCIVVARFWAEAIRALASIANNTKQIKQITPIDDRYDS